MNFHKKEDCGCVDDSVATCYETWPSSESKADEATREIIKSTFTPEFVCEVCGKKPAKLERNTLPPVPVPWSPHILSVARCDNHPLGVVYPIHQAAFRTSMSTILKDVLQNPRTISTRDMKFVHSFVPVPPGVCSSVAFPDRPAQTVFFVNGRTVVNRELAAFLNDPNDYQITFRLSIPPAIEEWIYQMQHYDDQFVSKVDAVGRRIILIPRDSNATVEFTNDQEHTWRRLCVVEGPRIKVDTWLGMTIHPNTWINLSFRSRVGVICQLNSGEREVREVSQQLPGNPSPIDGFTVVG
jgi:hypothetical protein